MHICPISRGQKKIFLQFVVLIVKLDAGGKQTTGPAEILPRDANTVGACNVARAIILRLRLRARTGSHKTNRKQSFAKAQNTEMKTLRVLALAAVVADAHAAEPDDDSRGIGSARLRGSAEPLSRTLLLPPPPVLKTNQTCWKREGVPGPGGFAGINGTCTDAFLEACATRSTIQTCAPNEAIALANANIEYGNDDPFTVWYSGTGSSCEWIYQPCP
jgi:hypothetical protein